MILILFIVTISLANALEIKNNDMDTEIKNIIGKYISKIPDVEPQYVVNEGLSKVISQYFNEKLSTFPLFKISLKIDRNPVRIPWTLGIPDTLQQNKNVEPIKYKYVPVAKEE